MRLIHGYTCHWYAQATLAALLGQSQTMSCVYLLTGLLISMPDSQKVMNESNEIVWFDGEGFSNCQNLYSKWELGVGREEREMG